ncbi:MAG: integrase core domain-containing protein [Desulfotomaculaceae bacterium]|nr:integrase core domain-containing protein [Desulfotomaculaceae bacterium]
MESNYASQRLSVSELSQTLRNISSIHRTRKMTIAQLSEYKLIFEKYGLEGLKDLQLKENNNTISEEMVEKVLSFSFENPSCGSLKLSNMLALQGFNVSPATIQSIFNKNSMTCAYDRILKLEEKAIQENIELTDRQIAIIEKTNPCFRERCNQSSRPGEVLAQDTIYIGNFRFGKIYLQAVVDTYGSYALGFLHSFRTPEYAVALLHNEVIPFYRGKGLAVDGILTDSGREYCGTDTHPFELYLALNDIEHRDNKESCQRQTNGFLDRFKKTALKEFFQKVLKGSYKDIKTLQSDFDNWLIYYNNEQPHRGYRNMGQCPIDTVNQYMV